MDLLFPTYCDALTLTASLIAAGFPQDPSVGARFQGVQSGNITSIQSNFLTLPGPSGPFTIIHGYPDLSTTEIASMTAVVNAYNPLPVTISEAQALIETECTDYIGLHYTAAQQQMFSTLLTQGIALNYTNRVAYISSGLAWVETVTNYMYSQQDAIAACSTVDAVNSITWNFSEQFDTTDPLITVRQAQSLTN
jgi:hypothetical protein